MKYVTWFFGILIGLALLMGITQMVASERIEVIELATNDEAGEEKVTRLWIVDHDDHLYLRGDNDSGWYQRVLASEEVTITRGEQTANYTHTIRNENIATINGLMREKYTWGDQVITALVGSREQSNAVELTLAE